MTVASRTPVPEPTAGGVRRRRLGIMGGTFDPIHHGHLVAASEVAAEFALDEVIFVPTGQPWQKSDRQVSPAEDRYLMTVVATASNPRFTVSRVDIDRPGAGGPCGGTRTHGGGARRVPRRVPRTDRGGATSPQCSAAVMSPGLGDFGGAVQRAQRVGASPRTWRSTSGRTARAQSR